MPRLPHPRTALSGYADRRLPAWRRAVVRHHLVGCTRCAVEVAQIRALADVLRSTPPPVPGPSDGLLDRLLALGCAAPVPEPGPPPTAGPDDGLAPGVVPPPDGDGAAGRQSVGTAGVLVVAVVMIGTVGTGAAVTGVGVPWATTAARASVSSVLPALPVLPGLWHDSAPAGAVLVRTVENGQRP